MICAWCSFNLLFSVHAWVQLWQTVELLGLIVPGAASILDIRYQNFYYIIQFLGILYSLHASALGRNTVHHIVLADFWLTPTNHILPLITQIQVEFCQTMKNHKLVRCNLNIVQKNSAQSHVLFCRQKKVSSKQEKIKHTYYEAKLMPTPL